MVLETMLAYFLLALTTLFWAGNFVLARAFSVEIPPITMAFIRWSTALLILSPFVVLNLWRYRQLIKQKWPLFILLGALSVAGFNTLAYIGLQSTTAMNGTLLQSTMPIMILLLGSLFLGDKANARQWLGVSISLLGVLLLIAKADLSLLLALEFTVGDIWVVCAMMVWGTYSLALRWRPEIPGFAFFCITLVVGVMLLAPLSALEMQGQPAIEWHNDLYYLIAYLAVFPSILAYLFWNYGVARLGAQKAGLFIHLVPFWGMILSVFFLNETIQSFHLWGITLIFVGIYLAVITARSTDKASTVRS